MSNTLSAYTIKVLIIRPEQANAIVTLKDQKALGRMFQWSGAKFVTIHICRKEDMRRVREAKLSKKMIVTEVTEAQWANRFKLPETIAGTGIRATQKQLAESFVIG